MKEKAIYPDTAREQFFYWKGQLELIQGRGDARESALWATVRNSWHQLGDSDKWE